MATLTELLIEVAMVKPAISRVLSDEEHYSIFEKVLDLDPEHGYQHACGNPIEGRLYLVCNEPLMSITPDLLYEGTSRKDVLEDKFYGYLLPVEVDC